MRFTVFTSVSKTYRMRTHMHNLAEMCLEFECRLIWFTWWRVYLARTAPPQPPGPTTLRHLDPLLATTPSQLSRSCRLPHSHTPVASVHSSGE